MGLCLFGIVDLRQNIFQYQKGIFLAISVCSSQIGKHFLQFCGIYPGADFLFVGGQDGVFFCPHLSPVNLLLGLFTRAFDDFLDLLHLDIKVYQFIQGHVV